MQTQSKSPAASPASAARFLGRKASACSKCGGVRHYVNRLGGVVCEACSPPKRPEDRSFVLVAAGGVWVDEGGAAEWLPEGQASAVMGAAAMTTAHPADAATSPTPPRQAGRQDPPAPKCLLFVDAVRLHYFEAAIGGRWDIVGQDGRGVLEICGEGVPAGGAGGDGEANDSIDGSSSDVSSLPGPPGVYRPLDQSYFAWLVAAVDRITSPADRAEALTALREIAVAAMDAEIFGEWAAVDENWPRRPPTGYQPPRGMDRSMRFIFEPGWWERNARDVQRKEEAIERLKEVAANFAA